MTVLVRKKLAISQGKMRTGGEGGIQLRPLDSTPSRCTKSSYLHEAKSVSWVSIKSRPAPQVCPMLSRNRHQTDTKKNHLQPRQGCEFRARTHERRPCLVSIWCLFGVYLVSVPYDCCDSNILMQNTTERSSCRPAQTASREVSPTAKDTKATASPCRLYQDLCRYVEFLVQTTNHVER